MNTYNTYNYNLQHQISSSAMAPQSTLISALNRESGKAKLHVRATRVCEAIHTKKLLNTKVIFVDEKVTCTLFYKIISILL